MSKLVALRRMALAAVIGCAGPAIAIGGIYLLFRATPASPMPVRGDSVAALPAAPDGLSAYVVPVHDAPKGWSYPFSCCSGFDCRPVTSVPPRGM